MCGFILFSIYALSPKFNFQLLPPLSYKVDIDWEKKFIIYYKLKEGVIVGIEAKPFSLFQHYLFRSTIGSSQREILRETSRSGVGGIIPEIELPIHFPAPVAGIIGQGGKLDVSGSQYIEFGGSKAKNFDLTPAPGVKESWFPSLMMEQRLTVKLKGTVGEKVHVFIDHDSEREFDLKNTIRLEYKGDEDEIIQSIKAGNTELSLPGVVLIGGGTSHKGLFGIKSEAKIGPVNIVTIASKEEAETQTKAWKGGGKQEVEVTIDDINFEKAKFFYLAPPRYVRSLQNVHNIFSGDPSLLPKKIIFLKVYFDEAEEEGGIDGKAFDIPNKWYSNPDSIDIKLGKFIEQREGVPEGTYFLDTTGIDSVYSFAILQLKSSLRREDVLAIAWKYIDWNGNTITVGDTTTLTNLQMIKRERKKGWEDTSYVSWWYEVKNIYSIGAAQISNVEIKIFKKNTGAGEDEELLPDTNVTYRKFLGLEIDGVLNKQLIDSALGIIQFPSPYPFVIDPNGKPVEESGMTPDSIYTIPDVYSPEVVPKYYIWIKYWGIKTEYSLGMMNIIENSENVKINGRDMVRGKDYTIDYEFGTIKFLTDAAKDTTADISITFQYLPIFQAKSKNLLGTRAYSKIGEIGEISSAFLYYSTSSYDFRPTLGYEPRRIILGELVGNITTKPEWMTHMVNKLPLVETEEQSSFSIQGNVGFSLPNPNTKGEVYLDDMEGAKSSSSLGIAMTNWSFGSCPPGQDTGKFAQVQWYNPTKGISTTDLYPDLPEHKKQSKDVLKLYLPPEDSWRYPKEGEEYWISLQTCILDRGMDFSNSRYLEVWVKGKEGKIHIDIGTEIPEDCVRRDGYGAVKGPNNKLDTEDTPPFNGLLEKDKENTGLDGVFGEDGAKVPGDDGNDDWHYDLKTPEDYSKINGTEGNEKLDTEDLDRDFVLDMEKGYFSFVIDLENDVPTIERTNGWKLFRISLEECPETTGVAQWRCIKYARIWIEGLKKGSTIEFAGLDIVGNKWRHKGSDKVKIEVKNNEEDKDYFSPPGVKIETDYMGRKEREQSLVLKYENLHPQAEGGGYVVYTRTRNFIQYKKIKLWIRGKGGGKFFIRIGGDKTNYYEYKTEITNAWKEVELSLTEMAQLKLKKSISDTIFVWGDYKIKGNPSFTNIGRIELGIVNEDSINISGEVWVNELRLTDPRREGGVAGNVRFSTKFADLGDLSFSYKTTDPYFQSLGTFAAWRPRLGTSSSKAMNISGGIQIAKFMPSNWGMNIPVSVGITKTKDIPKYETNSDVTLTEEESEKQSSHSLKRNFSIDVSKSNSKNKLLKLTLDNIKTRFSYNDGFSFTPTTIDSSLGQSISLSYSYSPSLPSIKIKGLELKYYPQEVNARASYSYGITRSYKFTTTIHKDTLTDSTYVETTWALTSTAPPTQSLTKSGGFEYAPINNLTCRYSIDLTNDLYWEGKKARYHPGLKKYITETGRTERAGANFSPSIGFVSPTINYSTTYTEDQSIALKLRRNISNTNRLSFSLPIYIDKLVKIVTGLRDEESDSIAKVGTPHWILMQTEKMAQKLHKPSFSHSISRAGTFHSLTSSQRFMYKFGFIDRPEGHVPSDARNTFGITWDYSISSIGMSIWNISATGGWRKTRKETSTRGLTSISVSSSFPQLNISISRIEKLFSLYRWFTSISTTFDYSKSFNKSGKKGEPFNKIGVNTNSGFKIQTDWKRGIQLELTGNFSKEKDEAAAKGERAMQTDRRDWSLRGNYKFRAPTGIKFPLLSHIKWKSDLDFSLNITYSTCIKRDMNTQPPTYYDDSKSIKITPQISYNFSAAVRGGANATYTQNWQKVGYGNRRNVEVKIFATFSF